MELELTSMQSTEDPNHYKVHLGTEKVGDLFVQENEQATHVFAKATIVLNDEDDRWGVGPGTREFIAEWFAKGSYVENSRVG